MPTHNMKRRELAAGGRRAPAYSIPDHNFDHNRDHNPVRVEEGPAGSNEGLE